MANVIHETAEVHSSAKLGNDNVIGPYVYIGPRVTIGDGNSFSPHASIGTPGQYRGKDSKGGVVIGNNNVFRENVTVHEGMDKDHSTVIGDDGYFMANAHIAHDCVIEDGVTMCNNATLGGDTHVMKHATLGLGATVHQGQTIGAYSMLGMGSIVPKNANIEPGEKYAGAPIQHIGRNLHALKKHKARDITDEEVRFWESRPATKHNAFMVAVKELQEYMRTRSREFQPRRYEILKDVIGDLPYLKEDDAANIYNMAFSLCWQQHENFQADQIFIRELLIDSVTGGKMPEKQQAKGKVGWLLNHMALGTYAPYKHVHAYLSGMEPCEIIVTGNVRDAEAREVLNMGHNITHVQGSPKETTDAIKQICRHNNIACLISDIYLASPLWAFMKRAAPLQAYLSPGFQLFPADFVLLPETQERVRNCARMPDGQFEFIPTVALKEHLYQSVERKKPGKVFGVLSRAEKCSREYLEMVQKVLDETGGEFHFYGRGELDVQDSRFKNKGVQNPHHALASIDVYLDSYPTCSGLSAYEAMAHGVPVITLQHESVRSWNDFKPCVVSTKPEYILRAAEALGSKGQEIATIGREIVESRLTNVSRAVEALYQSLYRQGWQP